jgi:hypothetical protein
MKRSVNKLSLHRETILNLAAVTGGKVYQSGPVICVPSVNDPTCFGPACTPDTTPAEGCVRTADYPCEVD